MSQHHARIKNDPRWKAARKATLTRDDQACVECGGDDRLQVDHIIDLAHILADHGPGRIPDDSLAFDLDNLRTLCLTCHQAKDAVALVRQPWVHPDYPELADLIGADPVF